MILILYIKIVIIIYAYFFYSIKCIIPTTINEKFEVSKYILRMVDKYSEKCFINFF